MKLDGIDDNVQVVDDKVQCDYSLSLEGIQV